MKKSTTFAGAKRILERIHVARDRQIGHAGAEALAAGRLVAPQQRRRKVGGGGTCLPITLNIWPTCPSGVQLPMMIRPPGLHTRIISDATSSGRGANIEPIRLITTSNEASG